MSTCTTVSTGHLARQRAPESGTGSSSGSTAGIESNWPNRIVRLDQFIMLGRGIRLNAASGRRVVGFRPSRGLQAE
ncbi:unnamed protein product [Staurois parvus]|uniref:Uncharacterized protein n=1 Tax=Staurois parvus TaxID=386267 RepID=A0ABN9FWT5_9NEOB|nr:unnamed protein product [Staurois parvus]